MKRRDGVTRDEFRFYYETTHRLLVKYFAHNIMDYRRSYPRPDLAEIVGMYSDPNTPEHGRSFDVLTEIWFEDAEALLRTFEIMGDPEIRKIFEEDEARFLDRASIHVTICEEETACEQLGEATDRLMAS
ncbi:EthD domain-containing protein [Novosphingobium colocasiae]